ncbi:MAG TPA: FmdB family zinc ribbon protein, partial [Quisquiliibacterium sp.]|nr:FmdB family zinc ribbon protein [Quisquiliibacterium sp.]
MPIFAYRCESCGFEKDVLQKRSDPPITDCPSCGQSTFSKRLTAPAFQLKGSGWYVTDFRDKGKPAGGKEGGKEGGTGEPSAAPAATESAAPAPAASAPAP